MITEKDLNKWFDGLFNSYLKGDISDLKLFKANKLYHIVLKEIHRERGFFKNG